MQGFKKTLVALLAVAMVLSLVGPVFAAEPSAAATRLQALGIVQGDEKGNLNEDQPVTRAEAAALVVRALGLTKSADLMKGVTKFADVNADAGLQWATGAINIAVSQNIINGYPNGQFGGRDQVTYAQFAKMMLYALNYGVTVEGGAWPTAVLAKADDLDLTDKMTVVADAPMVRGDVFQMIDNALDVPSLRQYGYGDLQTYAQDGDTLLKKIGLDEIEGQVVAIPTVDTGLKKNEVRVQTTKKNGDEYRKLEKYELIAGIDAYNLFGLEVKVWLNKDDEVVFADSKTSADEIVYDQVKANTSSKVKLLVKDKSYALDSDAVLWVNNSEISDPVAADFPLNAYGKVVLKNNKVAFAAIYNYSVSKAVEGAVVTAVDDEVVSYFTTSDSLRKLRLDDAEAYYIFKDGKEISLEDVEKDDVLYWYVNADDEYFITVAGAKVEGELDKARDDSVVIDGKSYKLGSKGNWKVTVSSNGDDDIVTYDVTKSQVSDLLGEEVVALLDLNGYVRHLRGDVKATSTNRGIVVDAWKGADYNVKVLTTDGELVTYVVEKLAEYGNVSGAIWGDKATTSSKFYVVEYKLNSAGEIKEFTKVNEVNYSKDTQVATGTLVNVFKLHKDGYLIKDNADGDKYYVGSNTVFLNADQKDLDGDDPVVVKWDDIKDTTPTGLQAVILSAGSIGSDARLVVFVNGFSGVGSDSVKYAFVTDRWLSGSSEYSATLDVAGSGEADYVLAGVTAKKGDGIKFTINAKGEANVSVVSTKTANSVACKVYKVDGSYIYTAGSEASPTSPVRVAKDVVVYDRTDGTAKADFGTIDVLDEIWYVLNDAGEMILIAITKFN